jgi:hypothetical protein
MGALFPTSRPDAKAYLGPSPLLGGASAVWDAVRAGVLMLASEPYGLVIVVSDGRDTASRSSRGELERLAQFSNVPIYALDSSAAQAWGGPPRPQPT